jgi:glycosyltransferase involved in cell wall biosynthesis
MTAFAGKVKKVLIIVENLPVPFDRRVWQEATTLQKAGYQVSVICPVGRNYEKRYEEIDGIAIYRHPLQIEGSNALTYLVEYSLALYWQFYLSVKVLLQRGFDVIQACNPPDMIFIIGFVYKLLFGKFFVFDHHDINPELYLAKFDRKDIFYRLMVLLERLTFKTADLSIATNNSYKEIAINRGGIPPDSVTVVRSSPSLERMKIVPPDIKWKNGKKYLVGYLGVMGKQEGIDHLLEAARILTMDKERDDVQFLLIGGGTELKALKELSRQAGLESCVTFTGRIPDEPMIEALNTADICVNPDVANEMNDKSTMNKIMEYMALGKPIVQYDLKEGRFSAGQASLYVDKNNILDFAEKIEYLLDHPEKRKMMGEFGRRRVLEELNWGIEAQKYLGVYQSLVMN